MNLQLQPNPELKNRILNQINYEQELLRLKRRLFLFAGILIISLIGFVRLVMAFWQEISDSGFMQLLGLASSDLHVVSVHISDYTMSLLEALPALSFALVAAITFVVLFSAWKFLRYVFEFKNLKVIKKI